MEAKAVKAGDYFQQPASARLFKNTIWIKVWLIRLF
jgi:hypothetical protein